MSCVLELDSDSKNPKRHKLCSKDELADGQSLEFRLGEGDWPLRVFLLSVDGQIVAYRNSCPHAGMPLNWRPDTFLTADKSLIICQAHGALFDKSSGECIGGPCLGQALKSYPTTVNADGTVVIHVDDLE